MCYHFQCHLHYLAASSLADKTQHKTACGVEWRETRWSSPAPKLICALRYEILTSWNAGLLRGTSSHQPPSDKRSTSSCYTTALGFLNRAKILRDMLCSCRRHTQHSLRDGQITFAHLRTPACRQEASWKQNCAPVQILNPAMSCGKNIMSWLMNWHQWWIRQHQYRQVTMCRNVPAVIWASPWKSQ